MAYEQREGQGSLFANDKKQAGSSQPDMTGNILLNGKKMRLAAWEKTGNSGRTFLSVQVSEFKEQPFDSAAQTVQNAFPGSEPVPEPDCPF